MFTLMPLFGPEGTELPCLAVFGPFPVDAEASSWLCCSSSSSFHTKKRHCLHVRNYYMKIYHGPERTEYCIDLNVLLGKAYEKPR